MAPGTPSSRPSLRALSATPSNIPSSLPSLFSSGEPSASKSPSHRPSASPVVSGGPSGSPSVSNSPSYNPTANASYSSKPSLRPSAGPSASTGPSASPSNSIPAGPTSRPNVFATETSTKHPTSRPSGFPTNAPSIFPTKSAQPTVFQLQCEDGSSCGDCDIARPKPGCGCSDCQKLVCEVDRLCCDVKWDLRCVGNANMLCGCEARPDVCDGGCGDCLEDRSSSDQPGGCSCSECESLVIAIDDFCEIFWDNICKDLAKTRCSCGEN
ncbi:hypothetical protein ACA910_017938 [Epithemia clementina (nom. ined.)]